MGNGFPGVAIVAVIVFFGALAGATLLILESWQENDVPLRLGAVPEMEGALGDAVAVAPAPGVGVASARVAPAGRTALVAAAAPLGGAAAEVGSSRSAIAPARVAVAAQPGAPSPPVQAPASEQPAALQPQPAPAPTEPAAVPVSVPASVPGTAPPGRGSFEGGMQGPIGSGVEGGGTGDSFPLVEGGEYSLSFSLEAEPTAYRAPGVENLVVRLGGAPDGEPGLSLQLWDDGIGGRGLWASGTAAGGERFLAPVADGAEHDVVVDFRAAGEGEGYYLLFLDGQPVAAATGVDLIEAGAGEAVVEVGLVREGEAVEGPADVRLGVATLRPLEPVLP